MKTIALKSIAATALALGLAAAPASAAPVELQPVVNDTAPIGTLVPETGSSGALNGLVCALQSVSASLPCLNT